MEIIIRDRMLEYLASTHAMVANFGYSGESASKIKYHVNLIM